MRSTPLLRSLLVVLSSCSLLTGCVSTATVPADELRAPGAGPGDTITTLAGSRARLGPSSAVRFLREDGRFTPWVSARSLWTNDRGVFLRHPAAKGTPDAETLEGIEWAKLRRAEVRNFEGGETVLATTAVVAVVGLIVAAVAADANDDDCGRRSRHCRGSRVASADTMRDAAIYGAIASSGTSGGGGGDTSVADSPQAPYFSDPAAERPDAGGARPIFDGAARRRAALRGVVALETTAPMDDGSLRPQPGAFAGVRLGNFFEVGLAARTLSLGAGVPAQAVVAGRVGFHGELDARRRFALPLSVDVGAGEGIKNYARINWGLRIRAYDELSIGLNPVSPTRVERESGAGRSGWSVSSGAELSWGF